MSLIDTLNTFTDYELLVNNNIYKFIHDNIIFEVYVDTVSKQILYSKYELNFEGIDCTKDSRALTSTDLKILICFTNYYQYNSHKIDGGIA